MTEREFIEVLSTPGTMAVVVTWFHFRLKRLEDLHSLLADRFGVDTRELYRRSKTHLALIILALLALSGAILMAGCAGLNWAAGVNVQLGGSTTTNAVEKVSPP